MNFEFFDDKKLTVSSAIYPYDVALCSNTLEKVNAYQMILVDDKLKKKFQYIQKPIYYLTANENNKSIHEVEKIWQFMFAHHIKKKDPIALVGGGIVHDVGIMAASLYLRGVPFDFFPTTLLSMVDVCVGGKAAVNAMGVKNLVGLIKPAKAVHLDLKFLKTLTFTQMISGLAEACKSAYIYSFDYFNLYLLFFKEYFYEESNEKKTIALLKIINLSLKVKKQIVEEDEFETSNRYFLNFGHTFGHALEAASFYQIEHGIAVALGMLCAIEFLRLNNMPLTEPTMLLQTHIKKELLNHNVILKDLKDSVSQLEWTMFWNALLSDKKNSDNILSFILPKVSYMEDKTDLYLVVKQKYVIDDALKKSIRYIFDKLVVGKLMSF